MTYVFYIDPITFFAESMRSAFYYKTWIWQDPLFVIVFLVIFALQIAFMCFIYRRTHEEVADVL
jgi:ABC-type polysaccharide/polyol phosphate export permease